MSIIKDMACFSCYDWALAKKIKQCQCNLIDWHLNVSKQKGRESPRSPIIFAAKNCINSILISIWYDTWHRKPHLFIIAHFYLAKRITSTSSTSMLASWKWLFANSSTLSPSSSCINLKECSIYFIIFSILRGERCIDWYAWPIISGW